MNSFIDRIHVQAYFLPLRFDRKITRKNLYIDRLVVLLIQ